MSQRLQLFLNKGFQGGDCLSVFLSQLCRLSNQALFQPRKSLVVISHLTAEQDVADLVDIPGLGSSVCSLSVAGFNDLAIRCCSCKCLTFMHAVHGSFLWIGGLKARQL